MYERARAVRIINYNAYADVIPVKALAVIVVLLGREIGGVGILHRVDERVRRAVNKLFIVKGIAEMVFIDMIEQVADHGNVVLAEGSGKAYTPGSAGICGKPQISRRSSDHQPCQQQQNNGPCAQTPVILVSVLGKTAAAFAEYQQFALIGRLPAGLVDRRFVNGHTAEIIVLLFHYYPSPR